MNALDEIKEICLANISEDEKIEKLVKGYGYTKKLAKKDIDLCNFTANFAKMATSTSNGLKFTFGVEIECYNVNCSILEAKLAQKGIAISYEGYNHNDHKDGTYKVVDDGSIEGPAPAEVVTPVLKDFESLKIVCDTLQEIGAKVNKSCGLHVHIGMKDYSYSQIMQILVNYYRIESMIDSFMPKSRRNGNYCMQLRDTSFKRATHRIVDLVYDLRNDIYKKANINKNELYDVLSSRYYKVNLRAYKAHETIEFRQHSGTIEYEKIKNWVLFLTGLCSYSINGGDLFAGYSIENGRLVDENGREYNAYENEYYIDDLPFIDENLKRYFKERDANFRLIQLQKNIDYLTRAYI